VYMWVPGRDLGWLRMVQYVAQAAVCSQCSLYCVHVYMCMFVPLSDQGIDMLVCPFLLQEHGRSLASTMETP
jgi:hypothetical protein